MTAIISRLPQDTVIVTQPNKDGRITVAISMTLENIDQALALITAIEKAVIPILEIAPRPRPIGMDETT